MAHLFINQIEAGLQINDVYMVTQPILRNTTRGDLYIASSTAGYQPKASSGSGG